MPRGVPLPRLEALRKGRFLTQEQLAELAGVARKTISRLERGESTAQMTVARKLAAALAVEPVALTGDLEGEALAA
jgi:DNA-binding XRE family transcriptional regulator